MKRKSPILALILGLPFWILFFVDMDAMYLVWLVPVTLVVPFTVGQKPFFALE